VLERALRHYSDPPPELRDEPRFRFDMSTLFMRLGRLDEARALLEQLLAEGGFLSGPPMVLHAHIAQVAALQGDRATVEAKDRWLREYDPRFASGGVTYYRALIHAIMGDKEETVRLLQQTVAKGGAYGGQMHSEFAFAGMRGYPPFEEWLRPKP
jgi:hypothetical protein